MQYSNIVSGVFLSRPNRFIAQVLVAGREERCHVKNTGRCRELLVPGAQVFLDRAEKPERKTAYDLVAVYKGERLINMDSQAPNAVAGEYLGDRFPEGTLRREVRHGDSRLDFQVALPQGPLLVEVKGVTLETGGVALFPDAPTARGTRHLQELCRARREGLEAAVLFVIQMQGVRYFTPNDTTDPAFGRALRQAAEEGVALWAVDCMVTPEELRWNDPVKIVL